MRIFRRYVKVQSLLPKMWRLLGVGAQIVKVCKSPVSVLYNYLFKQKIPSDIYLRNGLHISLSANENDIVTFVTIFCKKEYGDIKWGQPVVDIGANIGLFTLYAATHGASKIIAAEPNPQSFETLQKNIAQNNLHNVVAVQKAVSANSGDYLYMPLSSNPENMCVTEVQPGQENNYVKVETISLPDLLKEHGITEAALLKMDCEGAEYNILLPLTATQMQPIQNIKMEYHAGSQSLVAHFCNAGFTITRLQPIINTRIQTGMLEAEKKQ